MTTARTFARSAAVLGAATALTVAGAGAAMAATAHSHEVDGNDVSVTFTLDGKFLNGDACGAVITQVADAAGVAAQFAQATSEGSLLGVLNTLANNKSVHVLTESGTLLGSPIAALGSIGGLGKTSATVEVRDLPSNFYALVSVCASEPKSPQINPFVMVGNPLEAAMGSVESGSSGDSLGTMSSIIGGGDSGLGDILSSAVGGGEGDGLGVLSSAIGGGGE